MLDIVIQTFKAHQNWLVPLISGVFGMVVSALAYEYKEWRAKRKQREHDRKQLEQNATAVNAGFMELLRIVWTKTNEENELVCSPVELDSALKSIEYVLPIDRGLGFGPISAIVSTLSLCHASLAKLEAEGRLNAVETEELNRFIVKAMDQCRKVVDPSSRFWIIDEEEGC